MDSLDSELCLNCDEGGELFRCIGSDCPIAVHEKCKWTFDENGHFCCPYCLYKKAVAEKSRAWNNLRSKTKALNIFFKQVEEKQGAEGKSPIKNGNKAICCKSKKDTDIVSKGDDALVSQSQNGRLIGGSEGDKEDARMMNTTKVQKTAIPLRKRLDNTEIEEKTAQENSESDTDDLPLMVRANSSAKRGVKNKNVKQIDLNGLPSSSPSKGADASRLDNQNDVLSGGSEGDEEDAHTKDSNETQKTVTPSKRKPDNTERQGRRIGNGDLEKKQKRVQKNSASPTGEVPLTRAHSTAKRGVTNDNARCRDSRVISRKSKLVNRSDVNRGQSPSPSIGAGASRLHNQNDVVSGSSGGDEEDAHMKDGTEVQERVTPSRRELDNTERQGRRIDCVEEEKMHEWVRKVSASPAGEVPISRAHSTPKRGVEKDNSRCRDSELISTKRKLVKQSDTNRVQSPSPSKGARASRLHNQNDVVNGSSEDDKEDSHMKESIEVQDTISPFRRKPDKAAKQGRRIGSAEKEKMQKGVEEISAAPSEDPLVQAHSTAKRGVKRNNPRCRDSDVISVQTKRGKRSDMNGVEAPSTSKEADDSRLDSENDVVSASPESDEEDSNVKDSTEVQEEIPSRRKPDRIKMQEEQRISTEEEDEIQETSASTSEDSLVRAHSGSKRGVKTDKSRQRESDVISKRSPKFPKDAICKERRNKLLWREEEVKMIEEGVKKFSQPDRKISWKTILEYGRKVFHETRTPVDLKDKWKKMNK